MSPPLEPQVQVCFDVPLKRVEDLVNSALDCPPHIGAGYWARVTARSGNPFGPRGGCWTFRAVCDGNGYTHTNGLFVFVLDAASIQRGLTVFAKEYGALFGQFMAENEDGPCGDVFLQCCLFGEVVFS